MLYFRGYKFLCFILQFRERTELQRKQKKEESEFKIKCANKWYILTYPKILYNYAATNVHLVDTLVQSGDQFFSDHVDKFNARPL